VGPISCPSFVKGQNGFAEQIVDFSYRVETSSFESTFLSDVETAVLFEVSKLILTCEDIRRNGRFLQANDQGSIYQVGYPETGAISETSKYLSRSQEIRSASLNSMFVRSLAPCTPTEPSARYCFDVDSRITVIGDDGNESAVRAKVQLAISDLFIDGEAIEKQVPGATVYQLDDPGATSSPVPDSVSSSGPSPLVISLSVVLGIMVLVAVCIVYRWRRKRPKRGMLTTPAPFLNDDDLNTNLVDTYNSQNGDPDDDYSRYGYESAMEPFSEHHDEYSKLIGSSLDEQRYSGMENATIYEDDSVKMTSDDGAADVNDDLLRQGDISAVNLMRDEKLHVTPEGVATGYIDGDTAISIGSDLTDNNGYSAPDIELESSISLAQVFDDAKALGEAEATAFAMTSASSVTDFAVVRTLLLLPIVKILFGNPSVYRAQIADQEVLSLAHDNTPREGRESIAFSAGEQTKDEHRHGEARKRGSSADVDPDNDEKGIDRQVNQGLRDQSSEYGSEHSQKLYSEYDNVEGDPLPIVAAFSEGDAVHAKNVDENEVTHDDFEGMLQPGDRYDTNENRHDLHDNYDSESHESLDDGHSFRAAGEGAIGNNETSFVLGEVSPSIVDDDAKGVVIDANYDESDQRSVNYNESSQIDTTSNKGNNAHSMSSYEENIALESSNFGTYDDAGSRSGRPHHDDEPADKNNQNRYEYDDEDMNSRQGSLFNDDSGYSEIDDDYDRVSRHVSHFNDDSRHSEIDDDHDRASRHGSYFNDDSGHNEIDDDHDRASRHVSHFNDDSRHSEIDDDHDRVSRQGSYFNDDSGHIEIDDDHHRVSRLVSHFNDDNRHSEIDDDHDRVSRQGSYFNDDSGHNEIDDDHDRVWRQGSQFNDDSGYSEIDDDHDRNRVSRD
jgi:hypothetical protein